MVDQLFVMATILHGTTRLHQRQDAYCVNAPPIKGPMTDEIPKLAPMMP